MGNNLLSAKATLPVYDRNNLAPRIVHLGFGAFHRAHQGVYADILATEHFSDWGYYEVNLIGGEQQIADLQQQDNLYTVAEMSADAWTARVVGVVKKALHVQMDGLETVLAAMCEPQIAIVSLTITEKGYFHSPATGQKAMPPSAAFTHLVHAETNQVQRCQFLFTTFNNYGFSAADLLSGQTFSINRQDLASVTGAANHNTAASGDCVTVTIVGRHRCFLLSDLQSKPT